MVRSCAHLHVLLLTDISVCAPYDESLFYMETLTPAQTWLGIQSGMRKSHYLPHPGI